MRLDPAMSRTELLRAATVCFVLAAVALFCLLFSGCALVRRMRPPTATVTTPTGAVLTQTGDAQVPASVSTKTATQTLTLPAQSAVWQNAQTGAIEYRLSKDTPLTTVTKTEEAKAPQSFTPPTPPTVAEVKEAQSLVWYRIGVAAGLALAIFGLVRGWDMVMVGGGAVAGGSLFALFVQAHPLVAVVIGIGVGAAIVGPFIFHTQIKNLPVPAAPKPP